MDILFLKMFVALCFDNLSINQFFSVCTCAKVLKLQLIGQFK